MRFCDEFGDHKRIVAFPIEDKLVVAVASSALFDLTESNKIFEEHGVDAYREFQRKHESDTLSPGVAFPFVKRLLSLNSDDYAPVEVVLLSKNDPDSGQRVMESIESHGLAISRAAFLSGVRPHRYIPAFEAKLFLSANEEDVMAAIGAGFPAGLVLKCDYVDDETDRELRVAFDFDGVIADDESERLYQEKGLKAYHAEERAKADVPLKPGPLRELLAGIARIQEHDRRMAKCDPGHSPRVIVAIVTARNAPAHKRLLTTLRDWGIIVDQSFFLGGITKQRIIEEFRPHVFFDDQRLHLDPTADKVPSVHIPYGVQNAS